MLLILGLLAACSSPDETEPVFTPTAVASPDAVVWQGFDHDWLYNHRWRSLGSGFVQHSDALDDDAYPVPWNPYSGEPERDGWTYMATASTGTGADIGAHVGLGTHVVSEYADFASFTAHRNLAGDEGTSGLHTTWPLQVELPPGFADAEVVEVLLNGFWLSADEEEAKQVVTFGLQLGTPTLSGTTLSVDVDVDAAFDCDTPECDGCLVTAGFGGSTRFDYDLYVDVLVVVGAPSGFSTTRVEGPQVSVAWDGPPKTSDYGDDACLSEAGFEDCYDYWVQCTDLRLRDYEQMPGDAGVDTVTSAAPAGDVGVVGITGFSLALDEPHHMESLALGATDLTWDAESGQASFQQTARFRNWAQHMNEKGQDAAVGSLTAFGTEGAYNASLSYALLGFSDAQVDPVRTEVTVITEASGEYASAVVW